MPQITEKAHAAGFLLSEANGARSRDNVVVLNGQNLKAGHVVGKQTLGAVSAAAKAGGNTGNGSITLDPTNPKRKGAKPGVYTVRCITAATNGGTFRVEDPDGFVLGDTTITGGAGGTAAFDDDIKFTLTDGGTDFVAGDGFDVTIAAGSGKVVEMDPAAEDGSQTPAGVLYDAVHADGADAKGVLIARHAEVNRNELAWKSGISADDQAAAIVQLAALGVIVR
jgi:hypothetical protein